MSQELFGVLREVHNDYLKARNLTRLITYVDLKSLFEAASEDHKKHLLEYLKERDKDKITHWIKQEETKELELMNVRSLRQLASAHKVYGYGAMTKSELITNIRRIRNERSSNQSQ